MSMWPRSPDISLVDGLVHFSSSCWDETGLLSTGRRHQFHYLPRLFLSASMFCLSSPPLSLGDDQPSDELGLQGAPVSPAYCAAVHPRRPRRFCSLFLLLFHSSSSCPRCQKSRIWHQRTGPFQTSGLSGKRGSLELLIYDLRMVIMLMQMIHLVKILIYFSTRIIFASMPSHSATSLSAVLLYVQCVCFQAGFWSFMFWSVLFSRLLQFLKNQGCDIARLTF